MLAAVFSSLAGRVRAARMIPTTALMHHHARDIMAQAIHAAWCTSQTAQMHSQHTLATHHTHRGTYTRARHDTGRQQGKLQRGGPTPCPQRIHMRHEAADAAGAAVAAGGRSTPLHKDSWCACYGQAPGVAAHRTPLADQQQVQVRASTQSARCRDGSSITHGPSNKQHAVSQRPIHAAGHAGGLQLQNLGAGVCTARHALVYRHKNKAPPKQGQSKGPSRAAAAAAAAQQWRTASRHPEGWRTLQGAGHAAAPCWSHTQSDHSGASGHARRRC